jgi:glycine dehydrogenase subunit 1
MLDRIGVSNISDLFEQIPVELRTAAPLAIPEGLSEMELMRHLEELATRDPGSRMLSFLGAGSYDHHIPPVVAALISRGEFLTAYTPYQAEASQGTLQAIFEFQTLICQLTAMEVSNASLYDGASAAAEAVLMARRWYKGKRSRCLVSRGIHPQYRQVIQSYLRGLDRGDDYAEIDLAPDGGLSLRHLDGLLDDRVAVVLVGYPNYFGVAEDVPAVVQACHQVKATVCTVTSEPVALGVLEAPGILGADIAVAEGQPLGTAISYGGPGVGLIACAERFMRQLPGRLVGQTVDLEGRRSFVLTLATREQHIRREKATSNICTNQGLMALAVTVHLCLLGTIGFAALARLCLSKATYLKRAIAELDGFELPFEGPTFNEFLVRSTKGDVEGLLRRLEDQGILAGVPVAADYPELSDCFLMAVTEQHRREDLDRLIAALA